MNSDGQGSDEDSRLEEPNNHTNGDAKAETSSNIKISPDDGDESSVASTSKDAKSQARDRENNISAGKSKTKKKKKGAAHSRLREFRNSYGTKFFANNPPPDDIVEEEVITHVIGKKALLGKVWKDTKSGDYVRYRCYSYGIEYKIGDPVFIESQRPEDPFHICLIQEFRMSKRDTLSVHIKWFYRTNEVPEQVYQLLIQDRHIDHKAFHKLRKYAAKELAKVAGNATDCEKIKRPKLNDRMLRMRELFVTDSTEMHSVSVLRGLCTVYQCQNIQDVEMFEGNDDTFFFKLSYNPETRRLATHSGEIQVGNAHQAILPDYTPDVPIEDRLDPDTWEEMTWEPGRIHDHDLLMYLRAGRSMAAFAAMCDGETPDEGFTVASKDGIALNAVQLLHEANYDTGKALQSLLKSPFPVDGGADPQRRWPEEDSKEFIKGLRMHGKNFFKIGKEFLPHREVPELVEFYYLWKKTPGAASNRPRGRKARPGLLKNRVKTSGKGGKGNRNEDDPDDLSSCSEEPDDTSANGENGEKDDLSPYYCRHCYTTSSRDWHHAGKEKILVCLDCRIYFKKYGELPCLDAIKLPKEEDVTSSEEEEIPIEDIKPPTDKKIDINAIEEDSSTEDVVNTSFNNIDVNGTSNEPVEIKAELPKSSIGLLSPVPTMGTQLTNHQAQPPSNPPSMHPGMHHPLSQNGTAVLPPANLLPGPPPAHSNNEVQVLHKPQPQPPLQVPPQQQQPAHQQPAHQQQPNHQHQQMQHHQQQQHQQQQPPPPKPPTPQPPPPREDSPPPKPDGSECHRSQSAIFTRQWNRGEGNSCSRTDLYFKPVPDSKLDRKRQERLRKADNERADALKAQAQEQAAQAAKAARIDLNHHFDSLSRHTPQPPPPLGGIPPGLGSPYGGHMSDLERFQRERAMNEALSAAAASSPRPPFSNPPGTPGPPGAAAAAGAAAAMAAFAGRHLPPGMDNARGMEELLRANMAAHNQAERERHYVAAAAAEQQARMSAALATTDPLVRLQLAGVNPEIPGLHPAYASLLGGPRGPPPGGVGFDPRIRAPGDLMSGLRPPPGFSPRPPALEMYQRQLMMGMAQERDHAIRHQHAATLMAQQEEFLRLEQEARARSADHRNPPHSRPP